MGCRARVDERIPATLGRPRREYHAAPLVHRGHAHSGGTHLPWSLYLWSRLHREAEAHGKSVDWQGGATARRSAARAGSRRARPRAWPRRGASRCAQGRLGVGMASGSRDLRRGGTSAPHGQRAEGFLLRLAGACSRSPACSPFSPPLRPSQSVTRNGPRRWRPDRAAQRYSATTRSLSSAWSAAPSRNAPAATISSR
jgi:hypothetical protein